MSKKYSVVVPSVDGKEWCELSIELTDHLVEGNYPVDVADISDTNLKREIQCGLQMAQFFYLSQVPNRLVITFNNQSQANPDVSAVILALLLVNVEEVRTFNLPQKFTLASALRFQPKLEIQDIAISTLPNERDWNLLCVANIPQSQLGRFNPQPLPHLIPCIPPSRSCVFFPVMVNNKVELGWFTVWYGRQDSNVSRFLQIRFSLKGTPRHRTRIDDLVKLALPNDTNYKLCVECGGVMPDLEQNSWQLALVAAIQIAAKTMPASPWPLVATGCIPAMNNQEGDYYEYGNWGVGTTDKVSEKFDLLSEYFTGQLDEFKCMVKNYIQIPEVEAWFSDANKPTWQFAFPKENTLEVNRQDNHAQVLLTPVDKWRFASE